MEYIVPIIKLKKTERVWLEEIYSRNRKGDIFTYKDVWIKLHKQIPQSFVPMGMDQRLVWADGEQIRLLGIIAVEKNLKFVRKCDVVIRAIKTMILEQQKIDKISAEEIIQVTGYSVPDVFMILKSINEVGNFYHRSDFESNSRVIKSIDLSGNDRVFYQYLQYSSIEKMIIEKLGKRTNHEREYFTETDKLVLNSKIDEVLENLSSLKAGQEVLFEELTELKSMYLLSKKNWRQLFIGKLNEMVASGIISEVVSKRIAEVVNPVFDNIISGILKITN